VVSTVYEITVKDNSGKAIKELKQGAEITILYNEANLKAMGVSEDAISPSYFDETTGTWVKVDDSTIDKINNNVVLRVKHFSSFALVASADITPPPHPSCRPKTNKQR